MAAGDQRGRCFEEKRAGLKTEVSSDGRRVGGGTEARRRSVLLTTAVAPAPPPRRPKGVCVGGGANSSFLPPGPRSGGRAASVLEELVHHGGVGQRGDVAQVALAAGDLAEHAAHDLPCGEREQRQRRRLLGGASAKSDR